MKLYEYRLLVNQINHTVGISNNIGNKSNDKIHVRI